MAYKLDVSAEQNPIDVTPLELYLREAQTTFTLFSSGMTFQMQGWNSQAAYEAGKRPVQAGSQVQLGPNPLPPQVDPESGAEIRPRVPSFGEVYSAFQADFDKLVAIGQILAERYDPNLADAVEVAPGIDPAVRAEIEAGLDAINP